MSLKRMLVLGLVGLISASPLSAGRLDGQITASIAGKADDEATTPYSNYEVRAVNVDLGRIVGTGTLDTNANFSLTGLEVPARIEVQLYNMKAANGPELVCSEGPFLMSAPSALILPDVNIRCKKPPVALLLLTAGTIAGVTTGFLVAGGEAGVQSGSR